MRYTLPTQKVNIRKSNLNNFHTKKVNFGMNLYIYHYLSVSSFRHPNIPSISRVFPSVPPIHKESKWLKRHDLEAKVKFQSLSVDPSSPDWINVFLHFTMQETYIWLIF